MADNNTVNVKVVLDKSSVDAYKSQKQALINQEKRDAEMMRKVTENTLRSNLPNLKEIERQTKLHYDAKEKLARENANRINQIEKEQAQQSLKDAKMVRDAKERALNQIFGGQPQENELNIGGIADWTVIAAGIGLVVNEVRKLVSAMWDLGKVGAEFGVIRNAFFEMQGGVEQGTKSLELFRKALAGNVDDRKIFAMANVMKELGYSTTETAQVMDISERAIDKFDGNLESANNTLLRFLETGNKRGVFRFGIDVGEVDKKMKELSGTTDGHIEKLSTEEQTLLRTRAVIELYGDSITKINNKQKDNADIMASISTAFENFKMNVGLVVSEAIIPFVNIGTKMVDKMKEVISIIVGGDEGFQKFKTTILDLVNGALKFLYEIWSEKILPAYKELATYIKEIMEKHVDLVPLLSKVAGFFVQIASLEFRAVLKAVEGVLWVVDQIAESVSWTIKMLNKIPGVNIDTNTYEVSGSWEEDPMQNPTRKDFRPGTDTTPPGKTGRGTSRTEAVKERLSEIERLKKELDELNEKYKLNNDSLLAQQEILEKIYKTEKELAYYRGEQIVKPVNQGMGIIGTDILPTRDLNTFPQPLDIDEYKKKMEELLKPVNELTNSIGNLIGSIIGGGGLLNSLKDFLKSALTSVITYVQGLIVAAQAAAAAKAGLTFGLSLISDAPGILAAIAGLEIAKGFLNSFAEGGLVSGVGTGTSDSILARLSNGEFVVNAKATSQNLPLLQAINNNANGIPQFAGGGAVNVYINSQLDAISFFRSTMPKYEKFRSYKRL